MNGLPQQKSWPRLRLMLYVLYLGQRMRQLSDDDDDDDDDDYDGDDGEHNRVSTGERR